MGDAGRYTCEALNQAGRSEKHYNLNVWGENLGGWSGVPPPAPAAAGSPAARGNAASVVPGGRLSLLPIPLPSQPTTHPISLSVLLFFLSASCVPLKGTPHPDCDRGATCEAIL